MKEPRFDLMRVTEEGKGNWKAIAQYLRAGEKNEATRHLFCYLGR